MAGILSKIGNDSNTPTKEYVLTDKATVANLPTVASDATGSLAGNVDFAGRPCIGSICQVIDDSGLTVYMLSETGWIEI